jgi:DNA polymerase-4
MGGIDKTRSWPRVLLHVDMDAFFAAFEIRNTPQLKGKPVIVGGDISHRSVVTTASYEARKYGIKSGMPIAEAKRLCPEGVFISGTMGGYVYTASVMLKIFEHYSPKVEPVSVDEAFLDITGCHRIYGNVENLVKEMKKEIKERLDMTCSAGIAPTRLMAKMASGENKPDGLTIIDRDDFQRLFFSRPVDVLYGVGKATQKFLNEVGIKTVGELANKNEKELRKLFGKNGESLSLIARGEDSNEVHSLEDLPDDKSMSHETTLMADITEIDKIYSTLLWLSDKVARRLRQDNFVCRTVSVKIRSSSFQTITRDKTLSAPTDQCHIIYEMARKLIPCQYGPKIKVRLLGVKASNLEKGMENRQLELIIETHTGKLAGSTKAVDTIRDRYGESVIGLGGTKI